MKGYSLEVVRRVYDDGGGEFLEVRPDADTGSCVEIATPDAKSKEYWGDIRFAMPPAQARLLAQAIIAVADELEAGKEN